MRVAAGCGPHACSLIDMSATCLETCQNIASASAVAAHSVLVSGHGVVTKLVTLSRLVVSTSMRLCEFAGMRAQVCARARARVCVCALRFGFCRFFGFGGFETKKLKNHTCTQQFGFAGFWDFGSFEIKKQKNHKTNNSNTCLVLQPSQNQKNKKT